jgi:hypothetical protein
VCGPLWAGRKKPGAGTDEEPVDRQEADLLDGWLREDEVIGDRLRLSINDYPVMCKIS